MFLAFLLRLLGGAAIPLFLLSVLSTPVFAVDPLSLPIRDKKENPPALAYTLMGTRLAIQVYVWLGWAAYCTALALRYTSQSSVTNPMAFYVVAFIAVNVPIAFLAVKESAVVENDRERQRLRRGTALAETPPGHGALPGDHDCGLCRVLSASRAHASTVWMAR